VQPETRAARRPHQKQLLMGMQMFHGVTRMSPHDPTHPGAARCLSTATCDKHHAGFISPVKPCSPCSQPQPRQAPRAASERTRPYFTSQAVAPTYVGGRGHPVLTQRPAAPAPAHATRHPTGADVSDAMRYNQCMRDEHGARHCLCRTCSPVMSMDNSGGCDAMLGVALRDARVGDAPPRVPACDGGRSTPEGRCGSAMPGRRE